MLGDVCCSRVYLLILVVVGSNDGVGSKVRGIAIVVVVESLCCGN